MKNQLTRFIGLFSMLGAVGLGGGEWPDNPDSVVLPFGAPLADGFHRGLTFAAEGNITAWSEGEIIWNNPATAGNLGSNLLVLEHRDGFRSVYRGVESPLGNRVEGRENLGYAVAEHWDFEIIDTQQSRLVDPLKLLPSRTDLSPPRIGSASLIRNGRETELEDGMLLRSGVWLLAVDGGWEDSGTVVELSLYWVGERVSGYRYDALSESAGRIVMETPRQVLSHEIYDEKGRYLFPGILLNAGRGVLELRVRDESGRTVSQSWNLDIQ